MQKIDNYHFKRERGELNNPSQSVSDYQIPIKHTWKKEATRPWPARGNRVLLDLGSLCIAQAITAMVFHRLVFPSPLIVYCNFSTMLAENIYTVGTESLGSVSADVCQRVTIVKRQLLPFVALAKNSYLTSAGDWRDETIDNLKLTSDTVLQNVAR